MKKASFFVLFFVGCSFFGLNRINQKNIRLSWDQGQNGIVELFDGNGRLLLKRWMTEGKKDTVIPVPASVITIKGYVTHIKLKHHSSTGEFGNLEGMLAAPADLAWNGRTGMNSRWAVLDAASKRVVWVDTTGLIETWFEDPSGLITPDGITLGRHRDAWISDPGDGKIHHYNYKGVWIESFSGIPGKPFKKPVKIQADGFGKLSILDKAQNILIRADPVSGKIIRDYSLPGQGLGFLHGPGDFCILNNNYYVADIGNERVLRISSARKKNCIIYSGPDINALCSTESGIIFLNAGPHTYILDGQEGSTIHPGLKTGSLKAMSAGSNMLAVIPRGSPRITFYRIIRQPHDLKISYNWETDESRL